MSNQGNICMTNDKYYAMYARKPAKSKKDICITPIHGNTWLYSDKDPGEGIENVVIATNDPELLSFNPELGNNEIFNELINNLNNENL